MTNERTKHPENKPLHEVDRYCTRVKEEEVGSVTKITFVKVKQKTFVFGMSNQVKRRSKIKSSRTPISTGRKVKISTKEGYSSRSTWLLPNIFACEPPLKHLLK